MASGVTSAWVQLDNFRKLRVSWVIFLLLSHVIAQKDFWIRVCEMDNNRKNGRDMSRGNKRGHSDRSLPSAQFFISGDNISCLWIHILALVLSAWRSLPKLNDIKNLDDIKKKKKS